MNYKNKPVLIVDLDQTIRFNGANPEGFVDDPETVELYGDVEPALWSVKDDGLAVYGVTNQGGVAFGHKTPEEVEAIHAATRALFESDPLDGIVTAFSMRGGHEPFGGKTLLRKPGIGMLAVVEYLMLQKGEITDWKGSMVVGDRDEDEGMADRAEITFIHADYFFGRA